MSRARARLVAGVVLVLSVAWWVAWLRPADDPTSPCIDAITLDDPTGDCP